MNSDSLVLATVLTIASLGYFLYLGIRMLPISSSNSMFFKAGGAISRKRLAQTTAAAGISNATVALAYMQITPSFGIFMLIALIANIGAQFLTLFLIKEARIEIGNVSTLGNFAYEHTNSNRIRSLFEVVTIIGFFSALLAEVIIGSHLFTYLLPDNHFADYIGVLIVTSVIFLYMYFGGFSAILQSDSWQLRLIHVGLGSLLLFSLYACYRFGSDLRPADYVFSVWGSAPSHLILWWALITIILSVFGPIGQLSTWQRLSATKKEDRIPGVVRGTVILGVVYTVLFVSSLCFYYMGIGVSNWDSVFEFMGKGPEIGYQLLFPLLFVGLVAAMISTADTNALAIIYSLSFKDTTGGEVLKKKKVFMKTAFVFAVVLFTFLIYKKFNQDNTLLSIIFLFFGYHVLLAPVVFLFMTGSTSVVSERLLFYSLAVGTVTLTIIGAISLTSNNLLYTFMADFFGFAIVLIGALLSLKRS